MIVRSVQVFQTLDLSKEIYTVPSWWTLSQNLF